MPDVVVVKEGKQDAVSVVFPRLGWRFLKSRREIANEPNTISASASAQACACNTDLPGAETLEEEIERKAPHNSREENTHQRQTLDSLATPQLNRQHGCR